MSTTAARSLEQAQQIQPLTATPGTVADRTNGFDWLQPLRAWHLTSLDAPSVAAVWLLALTEGEPWSVRLVAAASLSIAVWLLYVGDRLLDGDGPGQLQARHLFHRRYRSGFQLAACCACPLLLFLLLHLPTRIRSAWCLLAVPMAIYAAAIHLVPVRRLPKELVVAWMFCVACVVPALTVTPSRTAVAGLLFGAACWLNCIAIARWEGTHPRETSDSTRWGARHFRVLCVALLLAGLLGWHAGGRAALASSVSAALLLMLDRLRHWRDAIALRALADAALLSPLLLWPWLR